MKKCFHPDGLAWINKFVSKNDLPSLTDSLIHHLNMFHFKKVGKFHVTEDPQTLEIVEKVLARHPFVRQVVTKRQSDSIDELQSVEVRICNINKYPAEHQQYLKWKEEGRGRIIGVGGPAAIDQTLLSSIIPGIR